MYLDFQGESSLETVRQFLRSDDSREARQLLQKLIEDKGVDELLLTLADVLKDHLRADERALAAKVFPGSDAVAPLDGLIA